jgi:Mn-containing catalase
VAWNKILPIPKFDSSKYPEVKKLIDAGLHRQLFHMRLDSSQMEAIINGPAPVNDGTDLTTLAEPEEKYPDPGAPERPEEFAPGLDPELAALADALAEAKEKVKNGKPLRSQGKAKRGD